MRTAVASAAAVVGLAVLLLAGSADGAPPILRLPNDIVAEATDASGAVVAYDVRATVDGIDLIVACDIPGSTALGHLHAEATFPIGETRVSCTTTDLLGNPLGGSFLVTVRDTTPPAVTVPASVEVTAESQAGTAVAFDESSAADSVDGPVPVQCDHASGDVFPRGVTTVTCAATDAHGNTGSGSFTVTVTDPDAPVITVPDDRIVEANGPNGTAVNYPSATAVDAIDGPVPVTCAPASGTAFSLGKTNVICTAVDSAGNRSEKTFGVTVTDTTPPVVTPPAPITVSTSEGSISRSVVGAFLGSATATDIVDPHPTVSNDAPESFPLGRTTVTFVASDASGNHTAKTSSVTVVETTTPGPPVVTPAASSDPAAIDRAPPGEVSRLKVTAGDHRVALAWSPPRDTDFDHVEITRSPSSTPAKEKVAYRGRATTFLDRGLANGVEFRYVLVAYDHAGNRSAGIAGVAMPRTILLVAPAEGSVLRSSPTFRWAPARHSTYYNLQLYRGSQKVLSAWPLSNRLRIGKSWSYGGRQYRLVPGLYRWFVWPGIGAKSVGKYGPVLGQSTFTVAG